MCFVFLLDVSRERDTRQFGFSRSQLTAILSGTSLRKNTTWRFFSCLTRVSRVGDTTPFPAAETRPTRLHIFLVLRDQSRFSQYKSCNTVFQMRCLTTVRPDPFVSSGTKLALAAAEQFCLRTFRQTVTGQGPCTLALRASQTLVYRELTERVIIFTA